MPFDGFPPECFRFYEQLLANNTKVWFDEHRSEFDNHVMKPAREFVSDMGARLKKLSSGVNADPRVDRSIFRIYRDTRFSKDKSRYKTHLGIWFWEGEGSRMDCSGFYVHLEPSAMWLGVGMRMFPSYMLDEYRKSVVHDRHGAELARIIKKLSKISDVEIGRSHYRRIPRGFDPDHANAEFLLFNTLHAGNNSELPEEIHSRDFIDWCFTRFKRVSPLHKWIVGMTERAKK